MKVLWRPLCIWHFVILLLLVFPLSWMETDSIFKQLKTTAFEKNNFQLVVTKKSLPLSMD